MGGYKGLGESTKRLIDSLARWSIIYGSRPIIHPKINLPCTNWIQTDDYRNVLVALMRRRNGGALIIGDIKISLL